MKILNIALLLLLFALTPVSGTPVSGTPVSGTVSCVKANDDVHDTNLVHDTVIDTCVKDIIPKAEPSSQEIPAFRFTPVIEWLNALGFIKKEEVLFLANEMLKQQRDVLLKEITTLKQRVETVEGNNLSEEDGLKLKFLLKHVEAYR